jgi:dTMP kinase
MYINFIGIDGSGKDTAYEKILSLYPHAIQHREPGGTIEAEKIRDVLLSTTIKQNDRVNAIDQLLEDKSVIEKAKKLLVLAKSEIQEHDITGLAEVYLYAASRAQSNETLVLPALKEGKLLLGRRSVACSMSYQGKARGYGMDFVWNANKEAVENCLPDLEILFDLPAEVAQTRLSNRKEKQDRLDNESLEFHRMTREGYLEYYDNYCSYPYEIIDATKSPDEVYEQVKRILEKYIK